MTATSSSLILQSNNRTIKLHKIQFITCYVNKELLEFSRELSHAMWTLINSDIILWNFVEHSSN